MALTDAAILFRMYASLSCMQLLARSLEQRNASADGVSAQAAGRARKARQQVHGTG